MLTILFPTGWGHYLAGGLIIGMGVSLIYVVLGKAAGISTFFSAALSFIVNSAHFQSTALVDSRVWRLFYALGLIIGAGLWLQFYGPTEELHTHVSVQKLLIGGVLVGFGARLSGGCTSGHGICGISSLSLGSLVAVFVFMCTAIITANLIA